MKCRFYGVRCLLFFWDLFSDQYSHGFRVSSLALGGFGFWGLLDLQRFLGFRSFALWSSGAPASAWETLVPGPRCRIRFTALSFCSKFADISKEKCGKSASEDEFADITSWEYPRTPP